MSRLYAEILWRNTDNVLRVTGLRNSITGEYLNNLSTVAATLYDSTLEEVTGQTWPLQLLYIPDTDGEYRGTIDYELALTHDATYYALLVADGGDGLHGEWLIPAVARNRTY